MEQITKHEYLDVYRITDGVLLNVKKYKETQCRFYWHDFDKNKKSFVKLSGLKNLYIANKDIEYGYEGNILAKGSLVYGGIYIVPLTNPAEYRFEIKTTDECFSGDYEETSSYLLLIIEVMGRYLNK
jgi:hypothetical protein